MGAPPDGWAFAGIRIAAPERRTASTARRFMVRSPAPRVQGPDVALETVPLPTFSADRHHRRLRPLIVNVSTVLCAERPGSAAGVRASRAPGLLKPEVGRPA